MATHGGALAALPLTAGTVGLCRPLQLFTEGLLFGSKTSRAVDGLPYFANPFPAHCKQFGWRLALSAKSCPSRNTHSLVCFAIGISVPTFNPLSVAQAGVRRRGPHLLMPASVGSLTADPPVLSSFAAHHPIPFQCAPSPSIWECCVAGSDGVQYALGPEARCCLRFEALPHCLGEGMALPPPPSLCCPGALRRRQPPSWSGPALALPTLSQPTKARFGSGNRWVGIRPAPRVERESPNPRGWEGVDYPTPNLPHSCTCFPRKLVSRHSFPLVWPPFNTLLFGDLLSTLHIPHPLSPGEHPCLEDTFFWRFLNGLACRIA